MKSKDVHQSKPVVYQGRYPNIPSLSMNYETRRQREYFPGHRSQTWAVSLEIIGALRKQETFWGRQISQRYRWQIIGWILATRRKKRRPLRRSVGRKNSAVHAEGIVREHYPKILETPPEKYWTLKIERGTLKNRAESSIFFRKAKFFRIHLVKQNNQLVILQMLQRSVINYMRGGSSSLTVPEKGRADKQTIINIYRPSDASTVDRNMHERMIPDKP